MPAEDASDTLSIAQFAGGLRHAIDAEWCVHTPVPEGKGPSALAAIPPGFSAVLTRVVYDVPPDAMAAMPNLKPSASRWAGQDCRVFTVQARQALIGRPVSSGRACRHREPFSDAAAAYR